MKKLLILMLVLGMASLASATPVITGPTGVAQNGSITLYVTGTSADADTDSGSGADGGFSGVLWVDYAAYSYQISSVGSALNAMGGNAAIDTYYVSLGGGVEFTAAGTVPWDEGTDVDAGNWFSFTFGAITDDPIGTTYGVEIRTAFPDAELLSSTTITVIPEPMTIALLGLGGLLLRRRK